MAGGPIRVPTHSFSLIYYLVARWPCVEKLGEPLALDLGALELKLEDLNKPEQQVAMALDLSQTFALMRIALLLPMLLAMNLDK